ncbi:MAG: sigma-70 family RNA polymerase sigma factor, partial [Planctomycetes bacterium]|nr:sigma-70 family RNA polymerase sigma factor [Planctomycetota bacterium]
MTADANQKLERCAYLCGERAWRLACMLTGNVTDAEDVLQQAFLVAASKVERLPKDDPWPWFAAVVTNVSRHHWRKHRRRTMEEPSVEIRDARANDPADEISGQEMNQRLKDAVASLPEQEREAVILTHVSGLSYSEAAKALDMPKATVALRVKDGLERLRGKLGAPEATVTTSLSALPLAMPAGGLDQALSAWVSAAQASVGVAGVGSAVTAAGVIGEAIMVKKAVLVAGAVLCVGIGAVSGVTVNNALSERSDRVPVAENTRTGGALNGGQDPAPEQDKRLTQTIPAGHTTIAVDEYNRLKEELSRSTTLLRER